MAVLSNEHSMNCGHRTSITRRIRSTFRESDGHALFHGSCPLRSHQMSRRCGNAKHSLGCATLHQSLWAVEAPGKVTRLVNPVACRHGPDLHAHTKVQQVTATNCPASIK